MSKKLTLSIVIPAYNEESYISHCLDSIVNQTIRPDEVIVVNNNSTDATKEIARRYSFVTLLEEKNQHQAFAQKTGFDAAKGDIIGRIDADTILPTDWCAQILTHFDKNPSCVAIKGWGHPYDVYLKRLATIIFKTYFLLAHFVSGSRMLWGANCAFRRSAWQKVSDQVLQREDIWEDYDLAFCLARHGRVSLLKGIEIGTSFRAVHKSFWVQVGYQCRAIRTFYLRTDLLSTIILSLLWLTMTVIYPIVLLDHHVLKPLFKALADRQFSPREYVTSQEI